MDGVAVAQRLRLRGEANPGGVLARGLRIAGFVPGPDHDTDLIDVGGESLFDQNAEDGLFLAVAIDQSLKRQSALGLAGRGDDGFLDSQKGSCKGECNARRELPAAVSSHVGY